MAFGLILSGCDSWDKANQAYINRDYPKAFNLTLPLAKEGEARAQSRLGYMYAEGLGVPQAYQSAFKWYLQAAEQGNAAGQSGLGYIYTKGLGVPQDYKL
ncbi:MAG: tetratricopeptide repeat protein, partial [Arenicellales bacterium]